MAQKNSNLKIYAILMTVLFCLTAFISIRMPSVSGDYNFDGFPLQTMANGTIHGGVFVSQGGYTGGSTTGTANYDVPDGTIIWSRLYVGVWNGNDDATGWVNTTFNSVDLASIFIGGTTDTNPVYSDGANVYGSGYGAWWVSYNVTLSTNPGDLNVATVDTTDCYDGRQYAILFITVYENSSLSLIDYWVNEGAVALNYQTPLNSAITTFSGKVDTGDIVNATFYPIYVTGSAGENDYLYFNHDLNDGTNKLNGNDVATAASGFGFDLLEFDVTSQLVSTDNYAKFWRGDESYLRPVVAALVCEHGSESSLDLTPTNIAKPDYILTNMTNTFTITVENVGSGNADAFNTTLYINGSGVDTKTVPGLDASSSVQIELNWTPECPGEYLIEAVADSSDDIAEENETNNTKTMAVTVVTNGYLGDKPLMTYIHGIVSGDLIYTWGDSYYSSVIYPKDSGNTPYSYTVHFELTLPEGATVKLARLYNYWTWSHLGSNGVYPEMYVTFEGYEVLPDAEYADRKGWGYYNYPTGTYAYNVTSYVFGSEEYTAYLENVASDSRTFCMDGFGLLVIYEHSSAHVIEYWVNEGADMLSSMGTSGGVSPEQATAVAAFEGEIETSAIENATLWTVVQSGANLDNMLFFNDKNWTGVYDGTPYSDLDIDVRNVSAWLMPQNNTAKMRAEDDYMMPSNAFLILQKKTVYEFPYLHLGMPSEVNAGEPFDITVTVYDRFGDKNTTYTGRVHFVSSDTSALLPTDYLFASMDNGVKTFYDVIMYESDSQWITVSDLIYSSTTPYTNSTTVNSGSLDHFAFESVDSPQTAGVSFNIAIRACDAWNNTVTSYTGETILSDLTDTIDPSESGAFSNGEWSGTVTITKAEKEDVITVTDASTDKTGSSNIFEIVCGDLSRIEVSPSSWSMVINDAKQFNATGFDAYDNIVSITPEWNVNGGGTIENNGLFTAESMGNWTVQSVYSSIVGEATVTVHTITPVVEIIEPIPGSAFQGIVMVSGNSYSNITEILRVDIRFDNGTWNTVDGTTEWHFEWNTTKVSNGLHKISVKAYDGITYSNVTFIVVLVENVEDIDNPEMDEGKEGFPNELYWVLGLIMMIIIVLLLILLFINKIKKIDEMQRVVCPKCANVFEIKKGTQQIHCPNCGMIGKIDEALAKSKNLR